MIRVILVGDPIPAREGAVRRLEKAPDLRLVGCFDDGAAAVRFAALVEPDIAILDCSMTRVRAGDVARRLRAVSPRTRHLMLSMSAAEVVPAVRALHAGRRSESAHAPPPVLDDGTSEDPLGRLSAREIEVLKLVVEGNTSNQMASLLGLSPKSVDTYRSRLMTKLGLEHVPALVKFAIRRGLTSA
jgi:DNA-binding NarL/FixJ family response regulator